MQFRYCKVLCVLKIECPDVCIGEYGEYGEYVIKYIKPEAHSPAYFIPSSK